MDLKENISLPRILIRFLTGVGAGISGSVLFVLILFAAWSIVGPSLSATGETINTFGATVGATATHPLFVYLVLFATFLGVLTSATIYTLLMTVVEERFTLRTTALTHAFFGNIVLMIFLIPAYLITSNKVGLDGITNIVLAHILISGIYTFLIIQTLHWNKYFLVSIYSLSIALALYFLATTGITESTSLVLASMPLLFGFLAMSDSFVMKIYQWIFQTYGNDVLNNETRFGSDYDDEAQSQNQEF